MISIVSNSFGNLMFAHALVNGGKLDICPVRGKLQIKFPMRTKETEAIMVLLMSITSIIYNFLPQVYCKLYISQRIHFAYKFCQGFQGECSRNTNTDMEYRCSIQGSS